MTHDQRSLAQQIFESTIDTSYMAECLEALQRVKAEHRETFNDCVLWLSGQLEREAESTAIDDGLHYIEGERTGTA